jgi:hypothetical protein
MQSGLSEAAIRNGNMRGSWVTNGSHNIQLRFNQEIPDGYWLGRTIEPGNKWSDEARTAVKERGLIGKGTYIHKDGVVKRVNDTTEWVKDGWQLGNPNAATRTGNHGKQANRTKTVWVNDGSQSKMVAPESLDEALNSGWKEGRIMKVSKTPKNAGRKWYTNGITNVMAFACPEGFYTGKTQRKSDVQ